MRAARSRWSSDASCRLEMQQSFLTPVFVFRRHAAWLARCRALAHLSRWLAASQRQTQGNVHWGTEPMQAMQALAAEVAQVSPQVMNAYTAVVRYSAQVCAKVTCGWQPQVPEEQSFVFDHAVTKPSSLNSQICLSQGCIMAFVWCVALKSTQCVLGCVRSLASQRRCYQKEEAWSG